MHVLPQLRELEERFPDDLVVVGVHSGKFRAERVTGNIAAAARRLGVDHAVVNDRQFRVWRAYGVSAWPTVVLLDPAGGIVGAAPGEFRADELAPALADMLAEAGSAGASSATSGQPGPPALRLAPEPGGPLLFPGRVLALPTGRLLVADTGHHRIIELQVEAESLRARVLRRFGSGAQGALDGLADAASFRRPEGMALAGDVLYVADTGNHLVRAVDLSSGEVRTVAGTGAQARGAGEPGRATDVSLSSPWDVAVLPDEPAGRNGAGETCDAPRDGGPGREGAGTLAVAMAGCHQLWRLDLRAAVVEPWVGTGREDLSDGPPFRCTLAQPSGLAPAGRRLYFVDSESSAVRSVDLDGRDGPEVETIVGKGLFDFGDEDGQGGHARLQHPYDLAFGETAGGSPALFVADTYNNRLKAIDPATKRSAVLAGDGAVGHEDGDAGAARFWGPQGVAAAEGVLYVADTDNHALRLVDLRGPAPRVSTLEVDG